MLIHEWFGRVDSMPETGERSVQERGEVTLPEDFREDNDIEEGEDNIDYRRHPKNPGKITFIAREKE